MTKTAVPLVITAAVRHARDDRRDAGCFKRLVQGDRDALADLYDAHAGSLFRHGLALTRCHSEAADLVQAVFLKLATTGAPLLSVRNPLNYLHRILRATWIDEQRRPAASREASPQEDEDASQWDGRLARRSGRTASDGLDAAIDVTRALSRLPAMQREIVQLHLIEGFSFREAGRITGVSMFTVASRYRVALERLRDMMSTR